MRQPHKATDRNALALAGLRITVGGLFIIFGQYKVFGTQFTLHGGFESWINQFLRSGAVYPFVVSGTAAACATECDSNRLSCSLRRVSHRDGSRVWNLRENSQRFRPDLHAFVIVFFQLSGRSRSILAILWSLARSFCARPLLSLFHH